MFKSSKQLIKIQKMGCSPAAYRQKSLGIPNFISIKVKGKPDKYLTAVQSSDESNIHSIAFQELRNDDSKRDQLWHVQAVENRKEFKIRFDQSLSFTGESYYLTLEKGKSLSYENAIRLEKIKSGEEQINQMWAFDLGKDYHFTLKNLGSAKVEDQYFLSWKFTPLQEDMTPYQPAKHRTHENAIQSFIHELEEKQRVWFAKFKGKYYFKRSVNYKKKAEQYATSSFPEDQMSPFLIAYPADIDDIVLILRYAKDQEKSVVARSGGHQYSGLSSGGDGTIVISMNSFNGVTMNALGLIEIGPCVSLRVASKHFQQYKVSIPHGECPFVNIGGHAQTGGFGHFVNSFGLCIDYVQAFDIVLADGRCLHVVRPEPTFIPQNDDDQLRIELFRGVLAGNAGSFGIVTKFYLNNIKDQDHPMAYAFCKRRNFDRDLFSKIMQVLQKYTKLIAADKSSFRGMDFMVSVGELDLDFIGYKQPMILLEGVYADIDKNVPYNNQFKQILDVFLEGQTLKQKFINNFVGFQHQEALSKIAGSYVRSFPLMTTTGREYSHPYKKRCNITLSPLKDQFLTEFVDQVAFVVSSETKSLFATVQMVLGGGALTQKGKVMVNGLTQTAIPNRDNVYSYSFDIFYNTERDPNAEQHAERLQLKMQKTVDEHFHTPGVGEKKYLWACFGDVDMRKKKVIEMYYENMEQYRKLQELKDKVDKGNLFNSLMTVKPTWMPIQQ